MATEIVPTASGGFDILPWIICVLLAGMCAYFAYQLITQAKPKSYFEDWEACKKLNAEEGARSAGRWVFVLVLGINGHIISTERVEKFEGALYRKDGKQIWEIKPDSLWNLAGVPTAFVWSDRYTCINLEAGEALTKKSLKEIIKNKREGKDDPNLSTDGWYAAHQLFEDENPEIVGTPWHVVDVAKMRDWTAPTTPGQFYGLINRIIDMPKKKSKGILSWILDNPLIIILIAAAAVIVFIFMSG